MTTCQTAAKKVCEEMIKQGQCVCVCICLRAIIIVLLIYSCMSLTDYS